MVRPRNFAAGILMAVILIVAAALFWGCGGLKNTACSPTATQVARAVSLIAQSGALKIALAGVPGGDIVVAALAGIAPDLEKIRDGYCVSDMDNFIAYCISLVKQSDAKAMQLNPAFKGLKSKGF